MVPVLAQFAFFEDLADEVEILVFFVAAVGGGAC